MSPPMADLDATATGASLRDRREAVVREHMQSENVHDFDTTIGTFSHPRYEIVATGDVYDGEAPSAGIVTGNSFSIAICQRPTRETL